MKVLLVITYAAFNQGGVTSQQVESISVCREFAKQINEERFLRAICVEPTNDR